jgi:uncharacterized protein (TIGR03066 family)
MATSQTSRVLEQLRRAALHEDRQRLSDDQLLCCFVQHRDEAAFEAIVRRHGPMVLGVCRRVLQNVQDAEDAFQATFLVLARKALSIAARELLANWLYGVAYNTALKARAVAARRSRRERQVAEMPEPNAAEKDNWDELQPLLDQELARLPQKYRLPVILCDLEGKTRKEAAQLLGWPEGTVSGRLARARTMLAKCISKHGLVVSGALLTGALANARAVASVPAALVAATVKSAGLLGAGEAVTAGLVSGNVSALLEGVLKSMLLTKLKTVAEEKETPKDNTGKIIGVWVVTKADPHTLPIHATVTFAKGNAAKMVWLAEGKEHTTEGTYKVDATKFSLIRKHGDKEQTQTFSIKKLTDSELILEDDKGKSAELKAKKGAK